MENTSNSAVSPIKSDLNRTTDASAEHYFEETTPTKAEVVLDDSP